MEAKEGYFKIEVWIKGRAKPLTGIRKYLVNDDLDVHAVVNEGLLKYYTQNDILRIEVEKLDARTMEMAKWKRSKR